MVMLNSQTKSWIFHLLNISEVLWWSGGFMKYLINFTFLITLIQKLSGQFPTIFGYFFIFFLEFWYLFFLLVCFISIFEALENWIITFCVIWILTVDIRLCSWFIFALSRNKIFFSAEMSCYCNLAGSNWGNFLGPLKSSLGPLGPLGNYIFNHSTMYRERLVTKICN